MEGKSAGRDIGDVCPNSPAGAGRADKRNKNHAPNVTKPQLDLKTDAVRLRGMHHNLENGNKFTASVPRPYRQYPRGETGCDVWWPRPCAPASLAQRYLRIRAKPDFGANGPKKMYIMGLLRSLPNGLMILASLLAGGSAAISHKEATARAGKKTIGRCIQRRPVCAG